MFIHTMLDKLPNNRKLEVVNCIEDKTFELSIVPTLTCQESPDPYIIASSDPKSRDLLLSNDGTYDIGSKDFKTSTVIEIIEIYLGGGKLNLNTVLKLLKKTYALIKKEKTLKHSSVPLGGKLTVVGDIHGQLNDLLYILDESGLPSETNKYIFNGDFVDRGQHSVEVICILFALYVAFPEYVILNRGNHEDESIAQIYGFQIECIQKYDELTFDIFCEIFRYLPLFIIIDKTVFVVHGGLFGDREVTVAELEQINRVGYVSCSSEESIEALLHKRNPENSTQHEEFYYQLQRDA